MVLPKTQWEKSLKTHLEKQYDKCSRDRNERSTRGKHRGNIVYETEAGGISQWLEACGRSSSGPGFYSQHPEGE